MPSDFVLKAMNAVEGAPDQPRLARVAAPQERDELWPQITANYPNHAGYQARTRRVIPVVLLERQTQHQGPA